MDDEILDVVNGHDEVIGTVNRKDYETFKKSKQGYIRASDMFIMNDKGELWTPIRTADKTIAPNGYDYGVAGHVASGETYMDTVIREAQEEVNLALTPDDIEFVAKLKSNSLRYIRCIYIYRTNEAPDYNRDDFVSAEWLTPENVISNIDSGHTTKSNLRETILVLQQYLQNS